jgi:hypothetical protein
MFPLRVKFSRTIKETIDSDQINNLLDYSREVLYDKDAERLRKDNNCIRFSNQVIKLAPGWTLMAIIDSGFVEIKQTKNNYTKMSYSITIITLWIISTIGAIIAFFSSNNDIIIALIAFGFLGFGNWLIAVLRHWSFFYNMTDKMQQKLLKEQK